MDVCNINTNYRLRHGNTSVHMLAPRKNKVIPQGDYISAEEASIDKDAEILFRCEIIDEVVKDNVMPLSKALEAYSVTIEQYLGCNMLRNKKTKIDVTENMLLTILKTVLLSVNISSPDLNSPAGKIVNDMRHLIKIK